MENKQNRKVQKAIRLKELADTTQWTRAKVALEFKNVVNLVQNMNSGDKALAILDREWLHSLSVLFDWFYDLLAHVPPKHAPSTTDADKIVKQVSFILGTWLDLVDSVIDRTIILLTAAGLSHNDIAGIYTMHRQTVSRRHTKALDMLVFKLKHDKYLKYPSKTDKLAQILSQLCDNE